jgi:DNA-directed RNA polymerase subunit RPC12/RpoP
MQYNSNPSPEELYEWQINAQNRRAILPIRIEIKGRYCTMLCSQGNCGQSFTRKLLPQRNDPVFVCPGCNSRIYVPVEW